MENAEKKNLDQCVVTLSMKLKNVLQTVRLDWCYQLKLTAHQYLMLNFHHVVRILVLIMFRHLRKDQMFSISQ